MRSLVSDSAGEIVVGPASRLEEYTKFMTFELYRVGPPSAQGAGAKPRRPWVEGQIR
jgi:hypothetical protein